MKKLANEMKMKKKSAPVDQPKIKYVENKPVLQNQP
jgi:hypothetical protein